jgi:hypothetical protein
MRRALALTLLLSAAPIVVGCSDGDGEPTATTAPVASSTTTAAPTTTASEETTTTTAPAESAIALRGDGLGVVALGATPDAAVTAVTAELGDPSLDTGWEPSFSTYGTCPGEQIRGVEWGGLVLLFTNGDTQYGSGEHLFSWRVTGAPPPVSTATGLGYGSTAVDAEELYPGQVERVEAEDPFPAFLEIHADGGPITAYLDDGETITNLEAGAPCGE